jgi:hypothetical protein
MEIGKKYYAEDVKIEKQVIKSIANSLAEEMAKKCITSYFYLNFCQNKMYRERKAKGFEKKRNK